MKYTLYLFHDIFIGEAAFNGMKIFGASIGFRSCLPSFGRSRLPAVPVEHKFGGKIIER